MVKPTVYIETTVISYITSRPSKNPIVFGRQELTREWWENKRIVFETVVSELVFQEAADGDQQAAQKRLQLINTVPSLTITEDAVSLAEELINTGPVPKEYGEDALHIAICAINGIDFLLTWNCKHLANAMHRHQIEAIVELHGYSCPVICTPAELMEE